MHNLHPRAWIAVVAVLVLIASHAAFLSVVSRAQLWLVVVSLVGLVVLKYVWRRRTR